MSARVWLQRGLMTWALTLPGCTLGNLSSQTRFSDSAYELNDAARWGEVDTASRHVSESYRPRFLSRRRTWGEGVSIAEVELSQLKLGSDKKRAVSEVTLSWYDEGGMTLHKSSITQRWESQRGTYRLVDEVVARGDRSVFADDAVAQQSASLER
jgi:hypothetical protein